VIAGQIAVEQVAVEPVGADAPMHLAHVHQVTGQPHARVVVQRAGGIERTHGLVHHRHTGAAFAHIGWQLAGIGLFGKQALVQGVEDARTAVLPDMTKVGAPAKLEDELVLHAKRVA
jgi:hypothetical protein